MTQSEKNAEIIGSAMQRSKAITPKGDTILTALSQEKNVAAFQKIMGDKTPIFLQTVRNVLLAPQNKRLMECEKNSILRSCMACAVTGLTIDPAFGQAAIVPFGNQATFMPMKNGLVHLANNTGIIQRLNAAPVYEGDIKSHNPFTGDLEYNSEPHDRDILIGYVAYIRFLNGADHYLYMTTEQIKAHGRRYSKSYNKADGLWQTNFPVMAEKTVIKQLLNKWGSMDTMANSKLWMALKFDQATPTDMDIEQAQAAYPDSTDGVEDVESEVVEE